MNIAVIFAGGSGQRMNLATKPKQFLEVHGKPIIIYTLEQFQYCDQIDSIVLVSLKDWIGYCKELADCYNISKLSAIVEGGVTGQESIYHGLSKAKELFGDDNIVLIHDGVRPLIDTETIIRNIAMVKQKRCAITIAPAIETIFLKENDGSVGTIIDRSKCQLARAPQSFVLKDIFEAHNRAINDQIEFIDSASMMQHYGYKLFCVEGKPDNIKITTLRDYYLFKAFLEANNQL
ncbi:MAG: 2-C-methyl-D-erythritol 4-phosphate cytidylyltransferase [Bacteroidales bacterium]|nr:2-C-methyl-D-erythritol 4-phosphate cytidylyltransferase [Bacteroidales bacterium]MBR6179003.1 2-C-methyl-D-erythritol 4-phosphate cytidylyltransferase [Bacteroidales bacterium]